MFSNITIGRYIPKESIIHKLNPITKILIVLLVLISINFFGPFKNLVVLLFINVILYLSNIELKTYYKNIYGFRYFIIGILLLTLITTNILTSLNSVLIIVINLLITSTLMYTTTISELNYGIDILISPLKYLNINYHKISIIITLSIKFIFLVFEEADNLFKAYKNRGFKFNGSIKQRMIKISDFLSTLVELLMKKADNISNIFKVKRYDFNSLLYKNKKQININDIISISIVIFTIILLGVI